MVRERRWRAVNLQTSNRSSSVALRAFDRSEQLSHTPWRPPSPPPRHTDLPPPLTDSRPSSQWLRHLVSHISTGYTVPSASVSVVGGTLRSCIPCSSDSELRRVSDVSAARYFQLSNIIARMVLRRNLCSAHKRTQKHAQRARSFVTRDQTFRCWCFFVVKFRFLSRIITDGTNSTNDIGRSGCVCVSRGV